MQFFLPNFEDLVDPEYDFVTDTYSPNRIDRFDHDRYAHEFFNDPIFDGMLISKTIVSTSMLQRIVQKGGVHAFCRLKSDVPVMGDCGAFSYVKEDEPPYTSQEILEYYRRLGFTYGVSIDHLVFSSMTPVERERRQALTLDNAQEFLDHHRSGGYTFTPVGIAQGWDPLSRRRAIEELLAMGYENLALGGMVRSKDREIHESLSAIHPVLPTDAKLHIFGIARLSILPTLVRFGVTSADSASPIRRAFLGTGEDNYWTENGDMYAAIRIPEAKTGASKKRGIDSTESVLERENLSLGDMQALEQKCLGLMRAYHQGSASLEDTLEAVLDYDRLHGAKRIHEEAYRRTLTDRPWQQCPCAICQQYGVDVIIFRGNNRNRRRGFHNAKVFYGQFHETVARSGQRIEDVQQSVTESQLTFDLSA